MLPGEKNPSTFENINLAPQEAVYKEGFTQICCQIHRKTSDHAKW